MQTIHNPDRYMSDLRQILSQGRKRIGLLIGAGAPTAIRVGKDGKVSESGEPLIPDVRRLTSAVVSELSDSEARVVSLLSADLAKTATQYLNIEAILSHIRLLSAALGEAVVHGLDGAGYRTLGEAICQKIGSKVGASLPKELTPYSDVMSWIGGTSREAAVEIFTPNYDLLFEEAFERAGLPYFDGFAGGHAPFFDPPSIANDSLPARWSRLWKLHGSLGWTVHGERITRTGSRDANQLIYPDHLKYDKIQRMPYSALFERLRTFLLTPDSLLLCSGFSFGDAHIVSVIEECLSANTHAAVLAFQYGALAEEQSAATVATKRPNCSVYAKDGAIIAGVSGAWRPGQDPTKDWPEIRKTFWGKRFGEATPHLLLGDFLHLARFFALAQARQLASPTPISLTSTEASDAP